MHPFNIYITFILINFLPQFRIVLQSRIFWKSVTTKTCVFMSRFQHAPLWRKHSQESCCVDGDEQQVALTPQSGAGAIIIRPLQKNSFKWLISQPTSGHWSDINVNGFCRTLLQSPFWSLRAEIPTFPPASRVETVFEILYISRFLRIVCIFHSNFFSCTDWKCA